MNQKDYKAIAKIMKGNLQFTYVCRTKVINEMERKRINDLADYFDKLDGRDFIQWCKYGEKQQFLKDCGVT